MLREILENLIEEKRNEYKDLEVKAQESKSVEEVREIGETLKKLKDEITEAEDELKKMDDGKGDGNGSGDGGDGGDGGNGEGGQRFKPLEAYTMRTSAKDKDAEKRAKEFAASGKMTIDTSEARAVLVSSGNIATPTGVGGINDSFNAVSSIVDQVTVEDCNGMGAYEVAYEVGTPEASITTEGSAVTEGDPVFKYAEIKPVSVDVITYVSKKIRKLTPLQYEEKIKNAALNALRRKVGQLIVNGTGSSQPYGIVSAKNNKAEAICKEVEMTVGVIDETTLRKIVMNYGGDENVGANAVLYLNKSDLMAFGDVRGTNEKLPVYEITPDGSNPNTGTIKDGGLVVPYCINSGCGALATAKAGSYTMVYGDPLNYTLGLFGNYEVTVSEDFKFNTKQLAILGEVEVGGNVCVHDGFVVIKAKAAA